MQNNTNHYSKNSTNRSSSTNNRSNCARSRIEELTFSPVLVHRRILSAGIWGFLVAADQGPAQPPARGKSARGELGRGLCRLLVGEDSRREREAAGGRYLGSRPATKLRTLVAAGHQTLAAAERESESESERE